MSSGLSNYDSARKKYLGNEGYKNSLQQAGEGAQTFANNVVAQQKNALRNAGQTNSGAAILAANNVANQYANQLANQQSMVENMGNQAVNTNLQGDQQRYQNNWNNVGQGLQLAGTEQAIGMLSDENCKENIVNLTKATEILKKHKKPDLKITIGE